jgi:hypothetical protein
MRNVIVFFGLAALIWFAFLRACAASSEPTTTRVGEPADISAVPPVPTERDPAYSAHGIDKIDGAAVERRSGEAIGAATHAVYDLCSKYFAFREGSKIDGTYVFPDPGDREQIVNVSVELAHPEKAGGDTLWYEVYLDLKGKPLRVAPQKRISAEMCGLEPGVATRFD